MDTLTHALSGALLARATAPRDAPGRNAAGFLPRRVAAGFLAAAAPDLDYVFNFFGPLSYLLNHRGITHSLLVLPLWALVLSWVLSRILGGTGGWRSLYGVCAMSLGAHIAGDVITSYGTMVFAPLSDWRAVIGTTFIIDLWFSGIILAGLLASLVWRRTRAPAVAATLVLVSYVGLQALLKERALDFARGYAASQGLVNARIEAQPRPVSPFNWTVYVSDDEAHRYADVNLLRKEPRRLPPEAGFLARLDAPYQPLSMARWDRASRYGDDPRLQPLARAAWDSGALGFFRWFARLPAFEAVSDNGNCVWFRDLRFVYPGRPNTPFQYGACREGGEPGWRAFRRVPADSGGAGRLPL